MASTKEYRDYILKQLSLVPGITCRPMMGEFLSGIKEYDSAKKAKE